MTKDNGYIYLIRAEETDFYKIGGSKDVELRLIQLQVGCPHTLSIAKTFPTSYPWYVEAFVHRNLEIFKVRGEWFELDQDNIDGAISTIIKCIERFG